jgi:hypothetical protein
MSASRFLHFVHEVGENPSENVPDAHVWQSESDLKLRYSPRAHPGVVVGVLVAEVVVVGEVLAVDVADDVADVVVVSVVTGVLVSVVAGEVVGVVVAVVVTFLQLSIRPDRLAVNALFNSSATDSHWSAGPANTLYVSFTLSNKYGSESVLHASKLKSKSDRKIFKGVPSEHADRSVKQYL